MPWNIKLIRVAVGILINEQSDILIAERPLDKYQAGFWEFPGGKIEHEETIFEALCRELKEEIGIEVIAAEPWMTVHHQYEDRFVVLEALRVTAFNGQPNGREGQRICWLKPEYLNDYLFLEGNQILLEKWLTCYDVLRLPCDKTT